MTATGNFKINMEALDKTLKEGRPRREERKRIVKKISDSRLVLPPKKKEVRGVIRSHGHPALDCSSECR